ncbi:MAG: IS200/IS605 family transposase [Planctomycetes bacterium]|nr:IS200/IS605 family transposase [Planctomycetota bacterium]
MGHTFANNLYHIIFSTKDRCGIIEDRFRNETHRYLCGIAQSQESVILVINSVSDHIHLLAKIKPALAVSDFVGKLKANSSRWLKERFDLPLGYQWQNGFSSFTVSESSVNRVRQYIENQQEHHKIVSFADELKSFLERHGIDYDPQHYLD